MIAAPVLKDTSVSVVIPVRDEADFLQNSLRSFLGQTTLDGLPLDNKIFEIIVLLNNCLDDSANIARTFQKNNSKLNLHIREIKIPKKNSNGGFVRRLLMDEAYRRLTSNGKTGGIIFTTDGDTEVSEDWIAANLYEIKRGSDAVGGRILFSKNELNAMNSAARNFHLIDEEYRLLAAELESIRDFQPHDASPRHHQHFNGSFAVTTEIYKKAGGVPDVRCLEDVAFFQSLMRIDAKFRHSSIVKVYTSARTNGRTEAGLSTQINDWKNIAEQGEKFFVESAESIEERLKNQNNLRQIWQKLQTNKPNLDEIKNLASDFCVSFDYLSKVLNKPQTFGILLENICREQEKQNIRNNKFSPEPVAEAVRKLKIILEKSRCGQKRKTAGI